MLIRLDDDREKKKHILVWLGRYREQARLQRASYRACLRAGAIGSSRFRASAKTWIKKPLPFFFTCPKKKGFLHRRHWWRCDESLFLRLSSAVLDFDSILRNVPNSWREIGTEKGKKRTPRKDERRETNSSGSSPTSRPICPRSHHTSIIPGKTPRHRGIYWHIRAYFSSNSVFMWFFQAGHHLISQRLQVEFRL